jgi:hypothetical protein
MKQLIFENDQDWNELFAGLVDGYGSLLINKKGYMSLEITMSIYDEKTLLQIKQKLKGLIKNTYKYLSILISFTS